MDVHDLFPDNAPPNFLHHARTDEALEYARRLRSEGSELFSAPPPSWAARVGVTRLSCSS